MLIIHECMGRDCGYLTAATANAYRTQLRDSWFIDELNFIKAKKVAPTTTQSGSPPSGVHHPQACGAHSRWCTGALVHW